jgi:CDP-diacylglycerol--serine O-phosphatidyltransferase
MSLLRHLPNALTLSNLTCGAMATVFISRSYDNSLAVLLVFLGAIFDLMDGAVARKVGSSGEFGKQLDSLADVVTFGVAPSTIIFAMLQKSLPEPYLWVANLAFMNAVCAALRLARFNITTSSQKDFTGMPSPANGLLWASILLVSVEAKLRNPDFQSFDFVLPVNFLLTMLALSSLMMVSEVRMFSLKFSPGGWKSNLEQTIFLVLTILVALLFWTLSLNLVMMIPLLLMLYMLFGLVKYFVNMMR